MTLSAAQAVYLLAAAAIFVVVVLRAGRLVTPAQAAAHIGWIVLVTAYLHGRQAGGALSDG